MAKDKPLSDSFGWDRSAVDIANNFDMVNSREGMQKVVAAMKVHGDQPDRKMGDMRAPVARRARKVKVAGKDPEPE